MFSDPHTPTLFNRNLPTHCPKASVKAFISWIAYSIGVPILKLHGNVGRYPLENQYCSLRKEFIDLFTWHLCFMVARPYISSQNTLGHKHLCIVLYVCKHQCTRLKYHLTFEVCSILLIYNGEILKVGFRRKVGNTLIKAMCLPSLLW